MVMAQRIGWGVAVFVLACGLLPGVARAGQAHGQSRGQAAFDMAAEEIGPLRLGLDADKARQAVSCPAKAGKEFYEGATGDYVREERFPGCGLTLKLAGSRKGGPKTVAAITAQAPCALTTSHGVGIGATEAQLAAAYGKYQDEDGLSETGKTFIVGSIYSGLIFELRNGRVTRMFLGAAAE
jgi:hypothetical protein